MKYVITAIALFLALQTPAFANNATVEKELRARPELSTFYQGLLNSGVLEELRPDENYTVFAPTNEAFLQIPPEQYPCFYSTECRPEVAAILRNHIIEGTIYIDDAVNHRKGGVFSIGQRFVNIGELNPNDVTVDGHNILSAQWFFGGYLYPIDGVIAKQDELAALAIPVGEEHATTTTVKRSISMPNCSVPGGCTDSVTQTTTIIKTVK